MAAFNANSGEINRSETSVSDSIPANPQAGEQLQELLTMLTELHLLKKAPREPGQINLPLAEKSSVRVEKSQDLTKQPLSFTIESPAIHSETSIDDREIVTEQQVDREPSSAKAIQPEGTRGPSEAELAQAVEKFKRLQQLLFERDLPEFHSNISSVQQRLANFERLISEPTELINLLKPLIPELLREQLEGLKAELTRPISPDGSFIVESSEIEAKLADLEHQIATFSQQQLPNAEELIKGLTPVMAELLNRKVEESKLGVAAAIAPTVNEVIDHQNGLEEKVLVIEDTLINVQQQVQQQPEDLVKQLLPIINESLHRKISELKLEVVDAVTPAAQVRIAWVEIEEKVLNIIESRLESQPPPIQQPEEIISRVMPAITELLSRKIDESREQVTIAIAPLLEAAANQKEVQVKLVDVESQINNLQRKQNSQPEEIMARMMPLMIESLNRKIDETKLEVKETIGLAVIESLQNSGIATQILKNENQIVELEQQTLAQIEELMARIMPAISQILSGKISEAKFEIESAIAPLVDAIIQNKQIESRLGQIEQKIVAIEHRIYESTDLFTDLLKPLIDELMVSHHQQLERSVIESILPLLDEVVNYNYQLNDRVTNLDRKLTDVEWEGDREGLIAKIKELFPEMMLQTINESQVAFKEALAPIIDEIINTKTRENRQTMGVAIAPAIPIGISHRISESPDEIAEALAPEMASAIKQQIILKREAMSDALYPILGSIILKYMAETIREINDKLEKALSFDGISRKFRSKLQGVSEAELLIQESTPVVVKAVFLIQKESGLVISTAQQSEGEQLDSEMVAGMLTAIRLFVNEWIANSGSLAGIDSIAYGTSNIVLEEAGSCYLALVVQGETRQWFKYKMRAILKNIIQEHGNEILSFNGDPRSVSSKVTSQLQKLIDTDVKVKPNKPPVLLIAGLTVVGLIGVPWGIYQYHSGVERRLEANTNLALQSAPELSVYRITADVRGKIMQLLGRVPNQKLRSQAEKIAQSVAPKLKVDNKIIAVDVPPDPALAEADVKRTVALLNKIQNIDVSARYAAGKVAVEGSVSQASDAEKITQAFEKIPGVKSVTNTVAIGNQSLSKAMTIRMYFGSGTSILQRKDVAEKLSKVKEFMAENSDRNFRIIGYSDFKSNPAENSKLALERARNVKAALVKQGIDEDRIQIAATKNRPEGVDENQPLWLLRTVTFEIVK
jgi:outer membrane protein OmpA-like peptidoglycan-associated protein